MFKNQDWKTKLPKIIQIPKMSFFNKILSCISKKVPLNSSKTQERDFIFCLAKTTYDDSTEGHFSTLSSVYRNITGETHCAASGNHWKTIGFQSDIPSRDIRGSGMLGPFTALHLVEQYREQTNYMWEQSKNPETNFPFTVSIFEKVLQAMNLVRNKVVNSIANKAESFVEFFMELCEVLMITFFAIYEKGSYNIRNYGSVKADFEAKIEGKVVALFGVFQKFKGEQFSVLKSELLSVYG